jgi:hypothetical protein
MQEVLLRQAAEFNDRALFLLLQNGNAKEACGLLSRALEICKKAIGCDDDSSSSQAASCSSVEPGPTRSLDEHMHANLVSFDDTHKACHHFMTEQASKEGHPLFVYCKGIFLLQESSSTPIDPSASAEVYACAVLFNLALLFHIFPVCEKSQIRRQKALNLYNLALFLLNDSTMSVAACGGHVLFTLAIVNNMAILENTNQQLSEDQGRKNFEYVLASLLPTLVGQGTSEHSRIVLAGFISNALTALTAASFKNTPTAAAA